MLFYAAAGLPVPGAAPVSWHWPAMPGTPASSSTCRVAACRSLSIVTDGITIFDVRACSDRQRHAGTIDYANGILSLNSGSMSWQQGHHLHLRHYCSAPQSAEIAVTPGIAQPVPRRHRKSSCRNPAQLPSAILCRAVGTCCRMAAMALKGLDASYGAGTFNKNTGAFVVTLGHCRRRTRRRS